MTDGESGEGEQVFLVPCDPANFERTVSSAVDLGDYEDRPGPLSGASEVRLWGVSDGARTVETFDRLAPGDLLLFYDGGSFVGVGRVGQTFTDEAGWASETFWDDEPVEHVFTIARFTPVSIPRAAVNHLFDYGPGYSPGFMRVAPDRLPASLEAIELALTRYDERQS